MFLWLIACFSFTAIPQNQPNFSEHYDFAITRPTVTNLERIIYLINNSIISIPDVTILAVYYTNEDYDYALSHDFVKNDTSSITIHFLPVSGELTSENIYAINDLSPYFQEIFQKTNGILFFGGDDLPPYLYNEKMDLKTEVEDTYRHFFELSFLHHLLGGSQEKSKVKPLLDENDAYVVWAFCLGMQTLNVATGGTLVQDIPGELYNLNYVEDIFNLDDNAIHKNYFNVVYPEKGIVGSKLHQIRLTENSSLRKFIDGNNKPFINSYHHQCVDQLGLGLEPVAYSIDGKIIEAVKHKDFKNVLGLQFHPEKIELYDQSIKLIHSPMDTLQISYFEILKNNNSYQFHVNIWKEFSKTFTTFK